VKAQTVLNKAILGIFVNDNLNPNTTIKEWIIPFNDQINELKRLWAELFLP
jgi:hypothetical protein